MAAQIAQVRATGRVLAQHLPGCGRHEDLAAVRHSEQPRGVTQREHQLVLASLVLARAEIDRPRLDGHADADRSHVAPPFHRERALSGERGRHCLRGGWKGRAEAIADDLEHVTTARLDRVPQERVVTEEISVTLSSSCLRVDLTRLARLAFLANP